MNQPRSAGTRSQAPAAARHNRVGFATPTSSSKREASPSTESARNLPSISENSHVPYALLSDEHFALTHALRLPTFEFASMRLLKRMAWYCEGSRIVQVFYPVFPPDQNAAEVLRWLVARE